MIIAGVEFLDTAWRTLVALSVLGGVWVAAFFVRDQLKPFLERRFWFRKRWPWLVRASQGSRDLSQLLRSLGKVQEDLGRRENAMVFKNIRCNLNRLTWCIWVEAMSVMALHSTRPSDRCRALRNLSQIEDEQMLEHMMGVVTGVLHDPDASKDVVEIAEAALHELQVRRKIGLKKQGLADGGRAKPSNERGRPGAHN